ncbi:hypothetical protein LDENG_00218080 [Lucifuga dentata]|nr:hypothetical protein LDENG_00218080 [Lucifuga dentata]
MPDLSCHYFTLSPQASTWAAVPAVARPFVRSTGMLATSRGSPSCRRCYPNTPTCRRFTSCSWLSSCSSQSPSCQTACRYILTWTPSGRSSLACQPPAGRWWLPSTACAPKPPTCCWPCCAACSTCHGSQRRKVPG